MKGDCWARETFEIRVQDTDNSERTLTCIIVSNKTNRGGRKIDIKGCQSEDYFKSPVVLAFHDDEKVIARCLWLKFEDDGIVAKFLFRDSGLANDIFNLYKEGFLTSWSIGFLPVSYVYEQEDNNEIMHITKWTLLEVSAVSIPMDSNAITLAIGQGIVHDDYLIQSVSNADNSKMLEMILRSSLDSIKMITELRDKLNEQINNCMNTQNGDSQNSDNSELMDGINIETGDNMETDEESSGGSFDAEGFITDVRKHLEEYLNQYKGKL